MKTLSALLFLASLAGLPVPTGAAGQAPSPIRPPAQAHHAVLGAGLPRFSHGDHRREPCASCHDSRQQHGELKIHTAADCLSCHHTGDARANCTSCHTTVRTQPAVIAVNFKPSGRATPVTRPIRFAHSSHTSVACSRCHVSALDHAPGTADCTGCHDQHHTSPAVNCAACHQGADALATHHLADHNTCATAACHGAKAANLPDSRAMCLVCHTPQTTHQPGKNCNTCHQVRRA